MNHLKLIRRLQNIEPLKSILGRFCSANLAMFDPITRYTAVAREVIPGSNVATEESLEAHLKNTLVTFFRECLIKDEC